jgi:uncharacterized protein (TIGR02270 family)
MSGISTLKAVSSRFAEEASFIWQLRTTAVRSPNFELEGLSKLDSRLDAHLDGLRIEGLPAWANVKQELRWSEAGAFFVAAHIAFDGVDHQRIGLLLEAIDAAVSGMPSAASAIGWLSPEQAVMHIGALLSSDSVPSRRIAIAGAAIHRIDPREALTYAASDVDTPLRTRAMKAIGELGRVDLLPTLVANLSDEDPACRYWAAWAHVLRAPDPALGMMTLRQIGEAGGAFAARAAAMVVRRMEPQAARLWYRKLTDVRSAIIASGAVGDPDAIPWLMEFMNQLPLARVAGEAFSMITGADLKYLDLDAKPRPNYDAGPTEDPKDENVELDPDENLPWPDVKLIAKWWAGQSAGYARGTRYLCGKPMTVENLQQVLRTGYQRQRAAAAIELVLRQPGTVLFNVAAPGFRQKELLGLALP